ncbi:unnamed protein product [Rhodiola kirilowii]
MNAAALLFHRPPSFPRTITDLAHSTASSSHKPQTFTTFRSHFHRSNLSVRPDFRIKADDGDADGGGSEDYEMDEEELEEVDNKKDYDVEYEPVWPGQQLCWGTKILFLCRARALCRPGAGTRR